MDFNEISEIAGWNKEKAADFESKHDELLERGRHCQLLFDELQTAQSELTSDGVREAMESVQNIQADTEQHKNELRREVTDVELESRQQQEQLGQAYHRRGEAMGRISQLQMGNADENVRTLCDTFKNHLRQDMEKMNELSVDLSDLSERMRRIADAIW
jgi:hypothetical protein